jgi:phasin
MATASKKSAPAQKVTVEAPAELVSTLARAPLNVAEPAIELEQDFRGTLERNVVESRAAFVRFKAAADEATSAFEVSLAAAKAGTLAINAKAFEALRANAEANFEFLKGALATRSLPDLIALQTDFARKQIEALTGNTKDIGTLTQKAVAETVDPIKEQFAKSLKIAV